MTSGLPARETAVAFITFCDGVEEGGLVAYALRGRVVARALIRALDELEAERSARAALQQRCETQQAILGQHAYEAMTEREPA